VVARDVTHPRGMAFGRDGRLYIAEAGNDQIGGRISRIERDGQRTTVVAGLPHSINAGVEDVGAAAVAFVGDDLYPLTSEADGELASSLLRIRGGRPEKTIDLLAYEARANPDGLGVESNPFAMVADGDGFIVVDAAANALVRTRLDGRVETVAALNDNPVPTGLARGPDGALHVALFGGWPHDAGRGRVERIDEAGGRTGVLAGLTMPIGVAFDRSGVMHVLEFSSGLDLHPRLQFRPDSGRLLRVIQGRPAIVADGLPYPTALTVDADGALLIAYHGAMSAPGSGVVLRRWPCSQPRSK